MTTLKRRGFWFNLQLRCDLYQAKQVEVEELKKFMPLS
jgi:plasmid maintenance system antidote protein VapI